jgi:uncharacterized protein YbaP (TraB family)
MLINQPGATRSAKLLAQYLCGLPLLLFFSLPLAAETSLWKISKNRSELYLGGTIHVLRDSDYPLPAAFQRAFDQASLLGLETDLRKVADATFQQQLLAATRYPSGQNLADHLSVEALQALQARCDKAGIGLRSLLPYKPAVAMLSLMHHELNRLGVTAVGVDEYFMRQAIAADTPIVGLETANQQLQFLAEMGVGFESEFILHSVADIEQLEPLLQEMIVLWRSGDSAKLEAMFVTPLKHQYPAIYRSILLERNRDWLRQIEALLETPETELVLVGVAHFPGNDGLLHQLQLRGYTIEQLQGDSNALSAP